MDNGEATRSAVATETQLSVLDLLLRMLVEATDLGCAVLLEAIGEEWLVCAVEDRLQAGVAIGDRLVHGAGDDGGIPRLNSRPADCQVSLPLAIDGRGYFGELLVISRRPPAALHPSGTTETIARLLVRELTQRKLHAGAEASRLRERERDRQLAESKDELIAILAHDLRNPLQAVSAGCELLGKRFSDPFTLDLVARMREHAARMSSLIDDVLDFANTRGTAGLSVCIEAAENVDNGLAAIVRELQDARPERRILANISVNRTVRCDVHRLQQLASNLLRNALDHGDQQNPVRFVATASQDELLIEVWNSGAPIAEDHIEDIFRPYWRSGPADQHRGLGLGLHICSQIVTAHRGRLTVSSTQESGTQFTVRLPTGAPGG